MAFVLTAAGQRATRCSPWSPSWSEERSNGRVVAGLRGCLPLVYMRRHEGYAEGVIRRYLRPRGIRITPYSAHEQRAPRRRSSLRSGDLAHSQPHRERPIYRLKQFRRVATRYYEKRAENYEAMLTIAAIKLRL
jgi:hypothetical protein